MAELFGKKTGCSRGQGGSMHLFDREFGLVSCTIVLLIVLGGHRWHGLVCAAAIRRLMSRCSASLLVDLHPTPGDPLTPCDPSTCSSSAPLWLQLGGYAFIGEGIPVGLGAAFQIAYSQVSRCGNGCGSAA